jgi:EPS-associated MarR family transcriptional regulator
MAADLSDECRYRILRLLDEHPGMSQRELAARLGMSLGKVNYCLRALIDKGVLKATRFCNNRNKRAYLYVLTPRGIRERAQVTLSFLKRKTAEYEALETEIAELRAHIERQATAEAHRPGHVQRQQ